MSKREAILRVTVAALLMLGAAICAGAQNNPAKHNTREKPAAPPTVVIKTAPAMGRDQLIVVNLSGRGDKDVNTVAGLKAE